MFISRKLYNLLVTHCPNWMEHQWPKYKRQWHLAGVNVTGSQGQLTKLYEMIRHVRCMANLAYNDPCLNSGGC